MNDTPRTRAAALSRQSGALRDECEKLEQELYKSNEAILENCRLRAELEMWRDGNIVREEDRNELSSLRRKVDAAGEFVKEWLDSRCGCEMEPEGTECDYCERKTATLAAWQITNQP